MPHCRHHHHRRRHTAKKEQKNRILLAQKHRSTERLQKVQKNIKKNEEDGFKSTDLQCNPRIAKSNKKMFGLRF